MGIRNDIGERLVQVSMKPVFIDYYYEELPHPLVMDVVMAKIGRVIGNAGRLLLVSVNQDTEV